VIAAGLCSRKVRPALTKIGIVSGRAGLDCILSYALSGYLSPCWDSTGGGRVVGDLGRDGGRLRSISFLANDRGAPAPAQRRDRVSNSLSAANPSAGSGGVDNQGAVILCVLLLPFGRLLFLWCQ